MVGLMPDGACSSGKCAGNKPNRRSAHYGRLVTASSSFSSLIVLLGLISSETRGPMSCRKLTSMRITRAWAQRRCSGWVFWCAFFWNVPPLDTRYRPHDSAWCVLTVAWRAPCLRAADNCKCFTGAGLRCCQRAPGAHVFFCCGTA